MLVKLTVFRARVPSPGHALPCCQACLALSVVQRPQERPGSLATETEKRKASAAI